MPKQLIIDGKAIEVEDGITLIQACELAGVEIPRFCYHERLSIAGNCRMCLIEVAGMPKPVASCAMGVNDLPPNKDGSPKVINTRSPMVKKAREGVMEFLLINHPLDCPICDQGGECDLQDQAMAYGIGGSRFVENKRAVDEKYLGPLIKTSMTRCIQCTRCVRYMTEVAGVEELGAIGRGEDMEITTYLERGMMSEMSANVVDLCPGRRADARTLGVRGAAVGAQEDREHRRDGRGGLGHPRRLSRPRGGAHPAAQQRCGERGVDLRQDAPCRRRAQDPAPRPALSSARATGSSRQAGTRRSGLVAARLKSARPDRIGAIAGDLAGAEEMFALKDLLARLGSDNVDCRQDGAKLDPKLGRASYLFNSTIEGIEQADAILLIGTNPRLEAAVLNARIRKRWRQSSVAIALIGERADLTYPYDYLGAGPQTLKDVLDGKHSFAGRAARRQAPDGRSSAPPRSPGRTARPCSRQPPRSRCWRRKARTRAGTRSMCCTPQPRASPASISGFVPGKGGSIPPRWRSSISSAPTSSIWRRCGTPSSSIRAATAMPEPSAPTWCCRAPPTPRRAPPT